MFCQVRQCKTTGIKQARVWRRLIAGPCPPRRSLCGQPATACPFFQAPAWTVAVQPRATWPRPFSACPQGSPLGPTDYAARAGFPGQVAGRPSWSRRSWRVQIPPPAVVLLWVGSRQRLPKPARKSAGVMIQRRAPQCRAHEACRQGLQSGNTAAGGPKRKVLNTGPGKHACGPCSIARSRIRPCHG